MHAWTEVCHLSQSSKSVLIALLTMMYAALAEELTRLCLNTESWSSMDDKDSPCPHAHNHNQNSEILINNCFFAKWFVCMHTSEENEAIVLQWPVQTPAEAWKSNGLVLCSMQNAAVMCANHRQRVTQFGASPSEEEEHFTFAMLYHVTGCVVCHENMQT